MKGGYKVRTGQLVSAVWLPHRPTPPPPSAVLALHVWRQLPLSFPVMPIVCEVHLFGSLFPPSLRLIQLSLVGYLTGFLGAA